MRIEQFEFFLEVVKKGSMQKAAETLHTSKQNVSKLMKQLEDELRIQIFHRNKYGVFLTADGELVYNEAQKILDSILTLQNIAKDKEESYNFNCLKNEEIAHFNLLVSHSSSSFASELLEKVYNHFCVSSASIIAKDSREINNLLEKDANLIFQNFDFILTNFNQYELLHMQKLAPEFSIHLLHKYRLGIRISKNNPLAKEQSISVKDIIEQPLIIGCCDLDYSSHIQNMLESSGITLKPKFIFNSASSSHHYVQKNLGYGIVPFYESENTIQNNNTQDVITIPLKERIFFYSALCVNPVINDMAFAKYALSVAKKAFN